MLSEKMKSAINEQIKWEFYSGYMYLSLSAFFAAQGLVGFFSLMELCVEEKISYAEKLFYYLLEQREAPKLMGIDQPPRQWRSPLYAFKYCFDHEHSETERFRRLLCLAEKEKDHATSVCLQELVSAQRELEEIFSVSVSKLFPYDDIREWGHDNLFLLHNSMLWLKEREREALDPVKKQCAKYKYDTLAKMDAALGRLSSLY